jgi:hypothetical protein
MTLPIILVHRGYASQVTYAVAQAKASNPQSDVVLLGDNHHRFLKFAQHADLKDYSEEAIEFEQRYLDKHLSPNEIDYELICFQRWFMLKQFMNAHRIEHCIYLDSDVMLYAPLAQEQAKFAAYDFTLSRKTCAHNSFWTASGLEKFCNFLMTYYTEADRFETLKALRKRLLARGAREGISDMTLLNLYAQENPDSIGETSEIISGSVYDQNINQSDGFEMEDGMKKVYWTEGKPFAQHVKTAQKVRLNTIHFQGPAKQLMKDFFTGNPLGLQSQVFYGKVLSRLQK